MPASRAAVTTSALWVSSNRPPKLLQPRPTRETSRDPIWRIGMTVLMRASYQPFGSRRKVGLRSGARAPLFGLVDAGVACAGAACGRWPVPGRGLVPAACGSCRRWLVPAGLVPAGLVPAGLVPGGARAGRGAGSEPLPAPGGPFGRVLGRTRWLLAGLGGSFGAFSGSRRNCGPDPPETAPKAHYRTERDDSAPEQERRSLRAIPRELWYRRYPRRVARSARPWRRPVRSTPGPGPCPALRRQRRPPT